MEENMNLEVIKDDSQKDLAPADNAVVNQENTMMLEVIKTGNIEAFERFIALREREESRHASLEFDKHFAEMQAEFLPATRSKKGYDYKYAPIESLQKQYGGIISNHGFSSSGIFI